MSYLGRRTLLIFGHLVIAIIHGMTGIFNNANMDTAMVLMFPTFIFIYNLTTGTVCWVYVTETVIDIAMGLVLFTL